MTVTRGCSEGVHEDRVDTRSFGQSVREWVTFRFSNLHLNLVVPDARNSRPLLLARSTHAEESSFSVQDRSRHPLIRFPQMCT